MIRSRLVATKTTPLARRGLVVAQHPLGAEVGVGILRRGGNAVDAAVATAFAMTVVEPFMSTIAGAGTMLVHDGRSGETATIDFNAAAPAAARDGMFRVVGGVSDALFPWPRVQDDANVLGPRSVAVPGSVAGLALALERFGTMAWRDVLQPAIALAREGFPQDWYLALSTAPWTEELAAFPETARTYLRHGRAIHRPPLLEPGDRVRYPELARSLALLAREGPDAFSRGAIGDAIDAHMRETGGLLRRADLAAYRPRVEGVLRGRYRDVELALSPGATGGITALEVLNVLAQFPPSQVRGDTVAGLHHRAEAIRRAFLDRLARLGDPALAPGPYAHLASAAYAAEVARAIRRGDRGAAPGGRRAGSRRPAAPECTTHVCVVDRRRTLVSLTHTAVSLFGARMVVPSTGILLNNGMIWFDPQRGKPNSVGPGKRVLSNMTPVLGFRRGRPWLALGAPGGRRIVSAIPQVLATLVDGGGSLQAAIEAPRLHTEGDALLVDERVGEAALRALTRRGHAVVPREESHASLNFAKPVGIRVTSRGLEAGLDVLRPAAAAGH